MSNYKAKMKLLADTIRSKCNISNKLTIENMISVIDNISTETGADAYVVVDDNGVLKAQKLSFNGTEASFDGTAETLDITKVGLFATTQDEPTYTGSGGGGAFYKCASVDTTAKTWNGYKAVLTDGVYSFEETVTERLTFGAGFTPAVGTIYNADATVRVDKMFEGSPAVPDNGLIFYLPFNGNAEPVEGEVTSTTGELTYGEANGIKYAQFRKSQYFEGCKATQDTVDAFTVACTVRVPSDATSNYSAAIIDNIVPPNTEYISGIDAYTYGDYATVRPSGGLGGGDATIDRDVFVSAIVACDADGNGFFYVNGNCVYSATRDGWKDGFNVSNMIIGRGYESTVTGYLTDTDVADVAVWNRVLTEEEIAQIAARAASMNG